MKTTVTFTSTIAPEIIAWVDKVAKGKKKTRRAILEEAVLAYKRDLSSESLRQGFRLVGADRDMIELAEWGMDDYYRVLKTTDS